MCPSACKAYLLWHAHDQDGMIRRAEDSARKNVQMAFRAVAKKAGRISMDHKAEIQTREREVLDTQRRLLGREKEIEDLGEAFIGCLNKEV